MAHRERGFKQRIYTILWQLSVKIDAAAAAVLENK